MKTAEYRIFGEEEEKLAREIMGPVTIGAARVIVALVDGGRTQAGLATITRMGTSQVSMSLTELVRYGIVRKTRDMIGQPYTYLLDGSVDLIVTKLCRVQQDQTKRKISQIKIAGKIAAGYTKRC